MLQSWVPPDPQPWQLPPRQIVSVDQPPVHSGAWLPHILGTWQPPDPQPWQMPPRQTVSVDRPPVHSGAWLPHILAAWTPPDPAPWQMPPRQTVSVDRPPGVNPGLTAHLRVSLSWVPPDPQPTLPRNLPAQFTAVQVDQPPARSGGWLPHILGTWQPPDPPSQRGPFLAQGTTAVIAPQPAVLWPWLSGIVSAWTPPDPAPTLPRNLPPSITAVQVDQPPIGGYIPAQPEYAALLQSWVPPNPAPWQRPPRQTVSVDNPPVRSGAWLPPLITAWQPPDPAPWQLPPRQIVSVDRPPGVSPGLTAHLRVSLSWVPPDPPPTLPRNLPAQLTAVRVDQPPGITTNWVQAVLGSWVPPDPQPTLLRYLPLAITGVRSDNPPGITTRWVSTVMGAWIPPDPLPTLPRNLPAQFTGVRVDNPPGIDFALQAAIVRSSWDTPPGPPQAPTTRLIPFSAAIAAAQPVSLWPWLTTVLSAWVAPEPAPMLRRPAQIVSVDPPPLRSSVEWRQVAPWAWQPPDPMPWQRPARQTLSVDNPPIVSRRWQQDVLRAWEPVPLAVPVIHYVAVFIPPPVVNPPPFGYPARVTSMRVVAGAWQPPDPQPQRLYPTQALSSARSPLPGREFALSPDIRAIVEASDVRANLLAPDARAIVLSPDIRAMLLWPDARTVLLQPDDNTMPQAPPQWSPAASADTDLYWVSLARWLPAGDSVNTPAVAVVPIHGDTNPLVVGSVSVDLGVRQVIIPPGVPYTDPGPRIQAQLSGGTVGKTYTTIVSWHDVQGRIISRQILLLIQW
jgi:hypothetical protein